MITPPPAISRQNYESPRGIARWWAKDGLWHIARPCADPDPISGLTTGGYRYTSDEFSTRDDALRAIENISMNKNTKPAITNLEAFEAACNRLGVEFRRDQKTYAWFGSTEITLPAESDPEGRGHCAHAVHVPGVQYEVGLIPDGKGAYKLAAQFWGPSAGLQRRFCRPILGESTYTTGFEVLMEAYFDEVRRLGRKHRLAFALRYSSSLPKRRPLRRSSTC